MQYRVGMVNQGGGVGAEAEAEEILAQTLGGREIRVLANHLACRRTPRLSAFTSADPPGQQGPRAPASC
jgi:hypothetical protein